MAEGTQRRLAAIVSADVVGYSRLMGMDETGTLDALRAHRTELIDAKITNNGGRIVKTMGDGLLLEFPSVVDATQCVIDIQQAMARRNEVVDEDKRIIFRMGIHLGDLVFEDDDIFGDGVNIAARIEAICEAGGVAISGTAHENIAGRIEVEFIDLGNQQLKNIARPVRVWQWSPNAGDTAVTAATDMPLPLPDKPSIAVLPFDNMSGDPEQEYFSDGIAEDIITALSRFHQFFVVARNSSFSYKGQAVEVKQVALDLGVQYVIEGSVRRAGNRVRITAQLIDAATDHHVWAERFDRDLDDIFAIQDEITERITMAVAPELQLTEMARARHGAIPELGVWELVARAISHISKTTEADHGEAQSLLSKAMALDPTDSRVHATLATAYNGDAIYRWRRPPSESHIMATELAEKAVELGKEDEYSHWILGIILFRSKRHEEAIRRFETAIAINPNYSMALGWQGVTLVYVHKYAEGLPLIEKAIRLSPKDPSLAYYLTSIGTHHFFEERFGEASKWAEKALHEKPNFPPAHLNLAAAHGMLGNLAEARAAYEQFDRLAPGSTITAWVESTNFVYEKDTALYIEGLRRAGMPEE